MKHQISKRFLPAFLVVAMLVQIIPLSVAAASTQTLMICCAKSTLANGGTYESSFGEEAIAVMPGEEVTVTALNGFESVAAEKSFYKWVLTGITEADLTGGSSLTSETITFVMPDCGVSVVSKWDHYVVKNGDATQGTFAFSKTIDGEYAQTLTNVPEDATIYVKYTPGDQARLVDDLCNQWGIMNNEAYTTIAEGSQWSFLMTFDDMTITPRYGDTKVILDGVEVTTESNVAVNSGDCVDKDTKLIIKPSRTGANDWFLRADVENDNGINQPIKPSNFSDYSCVYTVEDSFDYAQAKNIDLAITGVYAASRDEFSDVTLKNAHLEDGSRSFRTNEPWNSFEIFADCYNPEGENDFIYWTMDDKIIYGEVRSIGYFDIPLGKDVTIEAHENANPNATYTLTLENAYAVGYDEENWAEIPLTPNDDGKYSIKVGEYFHVYPDEKFWQVDDDGNKLPQFFDHPLTWETNMDWSPCRDWRVNTEMGFVAPLGMNMPPQDMTISVSGAIEDDKEEVEDAKDVLTKAEQDLAEIPTTGTLTEAQKETVNDVATEVVTAVDVDKEAVRENATAMEQIYRVDETFADANDVTIAETLPTVETGVAQADQLPAKPVTVKGLALSALGGKTVEANTIVSLNVAQKPSVEGALVLEVHPQKTVGGVTAPISNAELQAPVTFKVYLSADFDADKAKIIHTFTGGGEETFELNVQTDLGGKFVEVTVTQFSMFKIVKVEKKEPTITSVAIVTSTPTAAIAGHTNPQTGVSEKAPETGENGLIARCLIALATTIGGIGFAIYKRKETEK